MELKPKFSDILKEKDLEKRLNARLVRDIALITKARKGWKRISGQKLNLELKCTGDFVSSFTLSEQQLGKFADAYGVETTPLVLQEELQGKSVYVFYQPSYLPGIIAIAPKR